METNVTSLLSLTWYKLTLQYWCKILFQFTLSDINYQLMLHLFFICIDCYATSLNKRYDEWQILILPDSIIQQALGPKHLMTFPWTMSWKGIQTEGVFRFALEGESKHSPKLKMDIFTKRVIFSVFRKMGQVLIISCENPQIRPTPLTWEYPPHRIFP